MWTQKAETIKKLLFYLCYKKFTRGVLLPGADLTLLSLTEVLGGIFWVWLPIFGINEVPTANTIIGGSIITFALLYYSLNTKRNRRFIGLN